MSTTIEQLEIEVQSSAESAETGIDALASSLGRLKNAVKGGVGLTAVTNQITKLNTALSSVNSANTESLNRLVSALTPLSTIGKSNLNSFISQLQRLPDAVKALDGVNTGNLGDQITKLTTALQPLTNIGKNNLTSFVTQLQKLPQVMTTLDSVDMGALATKMQQLASALSPLATQMQSIANGFSAFPARIQRLVQSMNTIPSANNKTAASFTNLAAKLGITVYAMRRVASAIAGWITKSNKYVEDLNLFTVSMGEYAEEARNYAEAVSEVMGIDPADWLRNQGIFMTLASGFGVVSDRAQIMSQNLTQLGYDLASFFNISYEDAFLKIQSGLSGELEPLRRLGFDLSVARLQQEAYTLGVQKKVTAMTQAEKAELRYYAIMTQVTKAQGDMARTLNAPANQLRVLQAQVTQCARSLGNIFIPILNAVLPYAIALARAIRLVADAIASLFGFSLPQVDFSGIGAAAGDASDLADGIGDVGGGLGDATSKAKELKNALLGIDELNVISQSDDMGSGSGSSAGGAGAAGGFGGLGFELPTYDFLDGLVNTKIEALTEKFKDLLPVLGAVAAGFATWKVTEWIAKLMGLTDVVKALTIGDYLSVFAGLILTVGGAILYVTGTLDALKNGMNWKNLIKILGGIASAAAGVYLIIKPFSTAIAPIAAAGVAAAGGLGLFATSLNDIKKNGTNIVNLVGSFGGLATAVGGLMVVLKKFKPTLAPILVPLAAFAGALAIVKNTVVDIIMNGPNFTNVFGAIAGVIAAVTAAVYLWNAACALNPILGIAMIAVGIITAIDGIVKAVGEAGEAAYKSSEDYQVMENILNRCAETTERCSTALDTMETNIKNLDTVSNDFATASKLLDEIFAINENAKATAYDLELMAVKVDILNGLGIEGLSLSIDETTGRVIESRKEVEKLIASLEQEARMEAVRDLLVQSYKDQYQAMADAEKALADYDAAAIALKQTTEKLTNTPWYDFKTHSELTAAQKKQTEAVEASQQAYANAMDTFDTLGGAIQTYTDELVGIKLEEAGIGDELLNGVGRMQLGLEETAGKMSGYGKDIADGLRTGVTENVKEMEYKSIWQKIGDWFADLFEIHSPSKVFEGYGTNLTDGLLNGIKKYPSMQSTIEEWAGKVKEWFTSKSYGSANGTTFGTYAKNIIDGFKNRVSSSYTNSKSSITTWASNVKSWFSSNASSSAFSGFASDIIDGFKNKIGSSYTTARSNMQTFGNSVKSWFTDRVSYSKFYNVASDVIQGFKDGINELYDSVKDSITSWGSSIISWFKEQLKSNSPSKVFETIGKDTVLGYNLGIEALAGSTKGVIDEWTSSFTSVSPVMDFAVDTSALKYYDSSAFEKSMSASVTSNTSVTATGFKEGMEEFYREYVEPTMVQMATDMRRQADKPEQTVVQIGNRAVSDAVTTQQRANGYVFAR